MPFRFLFFYNLHAVMPLHKLRTDYSGLKNFFKVITLGECSSMSRLFVVELVTEPEPPELISNDTLEGWTKK